MAFNEKAWHVGFKWTIGDEDNPTGAICLDDSSDALHICEIRDARTDWAVSTTSHPTLYIHSATTPETDYIKMYHDGDYAYLNVDGTTLLTMTTTTLAIAADVTLTGDLALATEDVSVAVTRYVYFEGQGSTTYISARGANGLTVAATTEILLTTAVTRTTGTLSVAGQASGSGFTLVDGTMEVASGGLTVSGGATITGTIAGLGGLTIAGACTLTGVVTGLSHLVVSQGSYIFMASISSGEYIRSDAGSDLMLNATTNLNLAVGGTDEVTISSTVVAIPTNTLTIGSDGVGADVTFYGDTASVGPFLWDADLNILRLGTTPTASAGGQVDGGGMDLADGDAFEVNADTGGAALGAVYRAAIKGNVVHGTAQSGGASTIGVLGKLNTNTTDYGGGDHYGVRGHLNSWGSVTLAQANSNCGGVSAFIENEGTTTVNSGNFLVGVQAYQWGAPTLSGTGKNPAYWVRSQVGAEWQYGIYMYNAAKIPFYCYTTPTAAQAAVEIQVNDTSTLSAGRGIGLFVNYVANGTHDTSYGVRSTRVNTTISANVPNVICGDWYIAASSATVDYVFGLSEYWEDLGSAINVIAMIDLGKNMSNDCAGYDTFIRFREHTGQRTNSSIFKLEGQNAAHYLVHWTDGVSGGQTMLASATHTTNVTEKIAVMVDTTERFIYLYSS